MSLYTELIEAGVPVSNWQSDLYFPRTVKTAEILRRHPLQKQSATIFRSQIDGSLNYDVPFAFDPFWEKRQNTDTLKHS